MAAYEYMAVMRERGTADQWWLVWPGAINSAINPLTPAEWGWSNRVATENWIFMRELNT
jgi:hypothetical protein